MTDSVPRSHIPDGLFQIFQKPTDLQIIFPDDLPVIHDFAYTYHIFFFQQMLHCTAVNDPPVVSSFSLVDGTLLGIP